MLVHVRLAVLVEDERLLAEGHLEGAGGRHGAVALVGQPIALEDELARIVSLATRTSEAARMASDLLPIVATVELEPD